MQSIFLCLVNKLIIYHIIVNNLIYFLFYFILFFTKQSLPNSLIHKVVQSNPNYFNALKKRRNTVIYSAPSTMFKQSFSLSSHCSRVKSQFMSTKIYSYWILSHTNKMMKQMRMNLALKHSKRIISNQRDKLH